MTEQTVTLARSLHARPGSQLARTAAGFTADITLVAGPRQANAKSVLGLMGLGVAAGAAVTVRADGPDAAAALRAIVEQLSTPEPAHPKGA